MLAGLHHRHRRIAKYLVNGWQHIGARRVSRLLQPHRRLPSPLSRARALHRRQYRDLERVYFGGLDGRVPFLPINSLPVDGVQKIDVRISKVFPMKERFKASFTFDAFNVFNHRFFTSISTRAYTASIVNGQGIFTSGDRLRCGLGLARLPRWYQRSPPATRPAFRLVNPF